MEGIRAVFFDFDDTLGNREKYAYDCARKILEENVHFEDPFEEEAVLQDWMLADEKGNVNKNHVKEMLWNRHGIDLPYDDFNTYWDSRLWEFTVPQEDTISTLEVLQNRYQLGVITNGPSDAQRRKLRQAHLDRFFDMDNIIVSGDYGYHKPDPRLFLEACRRLEVRPQDSVYVGDIFGNDILGAHRAGMHPVWIWNWGQINLGVDVPVIRKISDILEIL
jgi:putative hydrolase of the HAD superfamily